MRKRGALATSHSVQGVMARAHDPLQVLDDPRIYLVRASPREVGCDFPVLRRKRRDLTRRQSAHAGALHTPGQPVKRFPRVALTSQKALARDRRTTDRASLSAGAEAAAPLCLLRREHFHEIAIDIVG